MTKSEAVEIVAILSAAFPSTKLQDNTADVYARCLTDIPVEVARAATAQVLTGAEFFPTIAALRKAALDLMPGQRVPSAAEAWNEVVGEMKRVGSYGTPKFSHPAIYNAVCAMDWKLMCLSENPVAERAHFLQIYGAYRERAESAALELPDVTKLRGELTEKAMGRLEGQQEAHRVLAEIEKHSEGGSS